VTDLRQVVPSTVIGPELAKPHYCTRLEPIAPRVGCSAGYGQLRRVCSLVCALARHLYLCWAPRAAFVAKTERNRCPFRKVCRPRSAKTTGRQSPTSRSRPQPGQQARHAKSVVATYVLITLPRRLRHRRRPSIPSTGGPARPHLQAESEHPGWTGRNSACNEIKGVSPALAARDEPPD